IPPLAKGRRDVPAKLETIFRRMLAKNPAQRYQSMGEVIAALESLGGSSPTARAQGLSKRRQRRLVAGVLVLALAALLAVAAIGGFSGRGRDSKAERGGEPRGEVERTKQAPLRAKQTGPPTAVSRTVAAPVEGSPAKQVAHVLKKLKEINPDFDGQGTHE